MNHLKKVRSRADELGIDLEIGMRSICPMSAMFDYANPDAWALYRNQPAWEFARFLALAEKGHPSLEPPAGQSSTPAARNLANVESSIRWTQRFLARL